MLSSCFRRREGQEIAVTLETPDRIRELQRKLCQRAKWMSESFWKKMTCLHGAFRRRQVGKSRLSGRKPHVRFDEGELEIGH